MCDPLVIAGAVLTVGSTVANTIASNQQRKARDDALAAERIRQRGFDQESDALNLTARERYEDAPAQQDEKTSDLAAMFTEQQGPPAPALLPTSGSQLVNREETQQRGAAKDFTNQQGENLARLRSFGETFGDIGRLQARDAGLLGQINSFRQNSQNVLPLELDAAQQKGAGARTLADIFNFGGQLAFNKAFSQPYFELPDTAPIPTPREIGLLNFPDRAPIPQSRSSGLVRMF